MPVRVKVDPWNYILRSNDPSGYNIGNEGYEMFSS
jgi:hypothetical protein